MLKSTQQRAPLPPNWTEHKAPSGHIYYYNTVTKTSTYTRPATEPASRPTPASAYPNYPYQQNQYQNHASGALNHYGAGSFSQNNSYNYNTRFLNNYNTHNRNRNQRPPPKDRPKSKHDIPGCSPWVLVKTHLGRRFVYNPDSGESFWRIPKDVIGGVVEFDIQERKTREDKAAGETAAAERDKHAGEPRADTDNATGDTKAGENGTKTAEPGEGEDEDDYDEIEIEEVTDSEYGEDDEAAGNKQPDGEGDPNGPGPSKRRRRNSDPAADADAIEGGEVDYAPHADDAANMEMGEDDIAYQLAQMGHSYSLDPGEYGMEGDGNEDEAWEEGAEGLPLTDEEASRAFKDLLDDAGIDPYTSWENVVAEGRLVDDARYVMLPNMRSRREAFLCWSADRIATAQAAREQARQSRPQDPRVPFVRFLAAHATPKLFWPEFRRKFKREPELRDSSLVDKEREKMYREHINRLTKKSEAQRADELRDLLSSVAVSVDWHQHVLHRDGGRGSAEAGADGDLSDAQEASLPEKIRADMRSIALPGPKRAKIIRDFLAALPPAPSAGTSAGPSAQTSSSAAERDALRRRSEQVAALKRRSELDRRHGQARLREAEAELEQAERSVGRARDRAKPALSSAPHSAAAAAAEE